MNTGKTNIHGAFLTRQEIAILNLVSEGSSNKQIAQKLFISIETVKTHLKNIYRKLEVNNKVSALIKSETLKYGLV